MGFKEKIFSVKEGFVKEILFHPLLFVATDLLQHILNKAASMGVIKAPLCYNPNSNFPLAQYTDDTIIFLQASQANLFKIKGMINCFSDSTGLQVNFNKSSLIPINVPPSEAQMLVAVFGCQLSSLPFPYLGLPLGITKPRFRDFGSLIEKVERRLSTSWLSMAGHLQIANSVLSALPTYVMCTFKLPVKVIQTTTKSSIIVFGRARKAYPKCPPCQLGQSLLPKIQRGLGVINLQCQNNALLIKHLHKFATKQSSPWIDLVWSLYNNSTNTPLLSALRGSRWWKDIVQLSMLFRAVASPVVGDGSSTSFWSDNWGGSPLKFPCHDFSFSKNKSISVKHFFNSDGLADLFFLPLSHEAFWELEQLDHLLASLNLFPDSANAWTFIWGSSAYSSSLFYNHHFKHLPTHPIFGHLWKAKCTNKIKVFFWLLLMDRLNTRNILHRKHILPPNIDRNCALHSDDQEETSLHLFFCSFSQSC
ncbi:hypothetical protein GUJ93_ZPchr0001g31242 [Zizania palustris]|uniref:Reverse transcriptase zinc-binding domain-containing protein n=1 Tax=Zizania palustris TaxID=103762 RepID=A0A8J5R636_ZIZPA|nr:hypothetical protein GUJ93_ZPchr0001g31242 [Zizania palustris]